MGMEFAGFLSVVNSFRQTEAAEKLLLDGASPLSDEQVLALALGSIRAARVLLREYGSLANVERALPTRIARYPQVGLRRAAALAAFQMMTRRAAGERLHAGRRLATAQAVYQAVSPLLYGRKKEVFLVLPLDVRLNLLRSPLALVSGTVDVVSVHPREVFRILLDDLAASGIVAHNHPSGDPSPSKEDISLTRRLISSGEMLGVPILDHVIFGSGSFVSLRESQAALFD